MESALAGAEEEGSRMKFLRGRSCPWVWQENYKVGWDLAGEWTRVRGKAPPDINEGRDAGIEGRERVRQREREGRD